MFPTYLVTCRELRPTRSLREDRQDGRHYEASSSNKLAKPKHRTKSLGTTIRYTRYNNLMDRSLLPLSCVFDVFFQTKFEYSKVVKLVEMNLNAQKDCNYIRLFVIYRAVYGSDDLCSLAFPSRLSETSWQ